MHIKIGTRGSKLALWQACQVEAQLQRAGMTTEIVTIETKGDKVLDVSIAKIGSKGVFTEEIEDQLASGAIDIAVHSAKDMQSSLPKGFELAAFMEREGCHDVIVSHQADKHLKNGHPFVLGTSSTRRVALLRHFYPSIQTVAVRGNLQTRIRKMEEGACDALLLAYAGVHRMGYEKMIAQHLSLDEFTPAVGQGSVAIEVHERIATDKKQALKEVLNHEPTSQCLLAERSFLKTMDGGCSIPVFGLATLHGHRIDMTGGIISPDGQQLVRKKASGPKENAPAIGQNLAHEVLNTGGREILQSIKNQDEC